MVKANPDYNFYLIKTKDFINGLKDIKIGEKSFKYGVVENFDWFILRNKAGQFFTIPVWAPTKADNIEKIVGSTRGEVREYREQKYRFNVKKMKYNPPIYSPIWIIPSPNDADIKKRINLSENLYNVPRPTESNAKLLEFNISKDFEKCGYKVCGLCKGYVMEEKHPVLEEFLKNNKYSPEDKVEDLAWKLSEHYSKKITEQLIEYSKKKYNQEVRLDVYALGY